MVKPINEREKGKVKVQHEHESQKLTHPFI